MKKLRNRARCKHCGDVVESIHRRDWVSCSCFHGGYNRGFFLDGGQEYMRFGGNWDDAEWMKEDDDIHVTEEQVRNIY